MSTLTLAAAQEQLRSGSLTPRALTESVIAAIEAGDGKIGGYNSIDKEAALAAADAADVSLPLGGLPIAIKDIINVKGESLTCSSKMLEGTFTSPYDATVIAKLRAAGAIPLGRTNMDEFAMGSSTENSALGITKKPMGHEPHPGWLERWKRGGGLSRPGTRRPRHRHGRFDPSACGALWVRGIEAHLRTRIALRSSRLRVIARSNRTDDEDGARLSDAAQRNLGTRRNGLDFSRRGRARFHRCLG